MQDKEKEKYENPSKRNIEYRSSYRPNNEVTVENTISSRNQNRIFHNSFYQNLDSNFGEYKFETIRMGLNVYNTYDM